VGFGASTPRFTEERARKKMDVHFGLFIVHSFFSSEVCVIQNQNSFN